MNEMHDLTQMLALFKTKINESNLIGAGSVSFENT